MPQLIALTCPVCGAPLPSNSDQCTYCGSIVFIKLDAPRLNLDNLNKGVVQEHIADFRKRVRANQFDEEAHYGLGVAYCNLGLFDAAVEELTVAARLIPENSTIQVQLAVVLRELSRQGDESARSQFPGRVSAALKLDPDNVSALSMQAEIYAASGKLEQAKQTVSRLSQINPVKGYEANSSVDAGRASWLVDQGQWDEASSIIQSLSTTDAREITITYLSKSQDQFPLKLSNPDQIQRAVFRMIGIIFVSILIFVCILALFASRISPNGLLALLCIGGIAIVGVPAVLLSLETNKSRKNNILITHESVHNPSTPMHDLLAMAEGLSKYHKGEMKSQAELADEQAKLKRTTTQAFIKHRKTK